MVFSDVSISLNVAGLPKTSTPASKTVSKSFSDKWKKDKSRLALYFLTE